MLFNSAVFLVMFVVVYALYWFLPLRGKQALIIVASLIFYAWYSVGFLVLFLTLIAFNYALSMALIRRKSKGLLIFGLIVDIGNLAFFKYFYFFAESAGTLLGNPYLADLRRNWLQDHDFSIALPIAISFYTFQIVAFLVDCYRGDIRQRISFGHFVFFILYFPQFVAGPIMRAQDFLDQIDHPQPTRDRTLDGSLLLIQGVVKKVLIADHIGKAVGPIWRDPGAYDGLVLLIAPFAFIAQIYCDFSGYTDMARGMSKMLGYEVPENFKGPFLATTMRDFWRRWHMTLSTWLRDYLFIPLGGSRVGDVRIYVNMMITMTLGGLWHGASWNMFFWGGLIGVYLCWERFRDERGWLIFKVETPLVRLVRNIRTVVQFAVSAIFFAAPGLTEVRELVWGVFTMQRGLTVSGIDGALFLTILAFMFNIPQYSDGWKQYLTERVGLRYALVAGLTFVAGFLVSLYGDVGGMFIYFQF